MPRAPRAAVTTVTACSRMVVAAVGPMATSAVRPVVRTVSRAMDVAVPRVVDAALRRIDVTALVRQHVDLDALLRDVDLDRALDRLDLVTRTETLIADVDLAGIIRTSSGAVASDAVQGFRLQGISGDEAVRRAMGRWARRRSDGAAPAELAR